MNVHQEIACDTRFTNLKEAMVTSEVNTFLVMNVPDWTKKRSKHLNQD